MAPRHSLWLNTVARPPVPPMQATSAVIAAVQDQQTYGVAQYAKVAYVAERSQAQVTGPSMQEANHIERGREPRRIATHEQAQPFQA